MITLTHVIIALTIIVLASIAQDIIITKASRRNTRR